MFAIALGMSPIEKITVAISASIFIIAFTWVSIKGDLRKLANELIEDNENNQDILRLIEKINDNQTRIIANTEREVLKILEGDCDTAIGVFAIIKNNKIELTAELFSVDGKSRFFIFNVTRLDDY